MNFSILLFMANQHRTLFMIDNDMIHIDFYELYIQ